MSQKSDYTSDEWQLLLDVPPAVGTAVMYAGKSGAGSLKEALALAKGILGVRDGYDGNQLVEALVAARIQDGEKSSIETLDSPYRGLEPAEITADTVLKCTAVAELLEAKASPSEADGYIHWAMTLGERVANAAKEGGFLGIGGERVSEEEVKVLKAVKQALRA